MCFLTSPTVKKLTNKLPDLLSKIESINQQLLPLGNISDNVDHIRELIQQARDAANKVGAPRAPAPELLLGKGARSPKDSVYFPESPLLPCPDSSVA